MRIRYIEFNCRADRPLWLRQLKHKRTEVELQLDEHSYLVIKYYENYVRYNFYTGSCFDHSNDKEATAAYDATEYNTRDLTEFKEHIEKVIKLKL